MRRKPSVLLKVTNRRRERDSHCSWQQVRGCAERLQKAEEGRGEGPVESRVQGSLQKFLHAVGQRGDKAATVTLSGLQDEAAGAVARVGESWWPPSLARTLVSSFWAQSPPRSSQFLCRQRPPRGAQGPLEPPASPHTEEFSSGSLLANGEEQLI